MAKIMAKGQDEPLSGVEVAQEVYKSLSPQSKMALPMPTPDNAGEFYRSLLKFEPVANEWAHALVNRIMFSMVKGSRAKDPLAFLEQDATQPGFAIQEVYVDMLDTRDWDMCSDYGEDIFRTETPRIYSLYHPTNFKRQVKCTIWQAAMEQAYTSWDSAMSGISDRVVGMLSETMRNARYNKTKELLAKCYAGGWAYPLSITPVDIDAPVDEAVLKHNVTKLRAIVDRLDFAKRDYNYMGCNTRTPIENILFITTPEFMAAHDVNVLASAFHMDKADFLGRVIKLDDFGGAEKYGVSGFIIDREWFKIFTNLEQMSEQFNPVKLSWNYWYTVRAVYSASMFSNVVILIDPTKLDTITSVSVTAGQKAAKCAGTQILATITSGTDDGSKYHYSKLIWEISGQTSDKTVIYPYGLLIVGGDEKASEITVTVKSAQDPTKTASATVTITG